MFMNACSGFKTSTQPQSISSTEMVVTDIAHLAQHLTREEMKEQPLLLVIQNL
jgi:hypothetical protein